MGNRILTLSMEMMPSQQPVLFQPCHMDTKTSNPYLLLKIIKSPFLNTESSLTPESSEHRKHRWTFLLTVYLADFNKFIIK